MSQLKQYMSKALAQDASPAIAGSAMVSMAPLPIGYYSGQFHGMAQTYGQCPACGAYDIMGANAGLAEILLASTIITVGFPIAAYAISNWWKNRNPGRTGENSRLF